MVYETFQNAVTSELKNRLGADYQLLVQKVPKNNGRVLDGLSICQKGKNIAPTIYLNSYFEQYQAGRSLESLIQEILRIYTENSDIPHTDFSILNDFSRLKDKVAYKLIHTQSNEELLKDIPSIPYLDLSIVFYLFLERNEYGQMTALIHNNNLAMWNTNLEELYQLASHNTPRLFPSDLKSMAQVMSDMVCQRESIENKDEIQDLIHRFLFSQDVSPLYVLTNRSGVNGACAMLYPKVLKDFASQLNQDLVILPSSIHEVLLLPYEETISFQELSDMVTQINQAEVPVEDRLSNHVYFYSRETDNVLMIQDSASSYLS